MIAQEAKFELLNYKTTKQGVRFDGAQETQFIDYIVKLTDADGEVVRYSITDYYNEGMSEIIDTRIWVLSDKILDDLQVKTLPDETGEGGRNDLFFYIADDDISKFAVPRLQMGIRWWEDVLGNGNGKLYPREILEKYPKTW